VALDLGFRHARVVLERERRDRSSASAPRQMPVKVTTAPASSRPRVSARASAATSNGSRWMRTVVGTVMALM